MVKRYSISNIFRSTSINFFYFNQWEIFFSFFRWANWSFYHISCFQAKKLNLGLRNIYIIGRCQIIIIRRAQKTVAVGHHFKNSVSCKYTFKFIGLFCNLSFVINTFWLLHSLLYVFTLII